MERTEGLTDAYAPYEGQPLQTRYSTAIAVQPSDPPAVRQAAREELQRIIEEVELHGVVTRRARRKIKELR